MPELKTRIQLKYDTLANWNASSFKLKAGEIAIATLGEVKDGSSAGEVNQHPVLFKVGTGNHTFSELPYASALAADVYAWAKKSESEFANSFLSLADTEGQTIQAKLNAIFATDAELESAIAGLKAELTGNDGLAGLAARVKAIEDAPYASEGFVTSAVAAEAALREAADNGLSDRIKAIEEAPYATQKFVTDAVAGEAALREAADQAEAKARAEADTALGDRIKAIEDAPYATEAYADQAEADAKADAAAKLATARTEITAEIAKAISDSATTEGGVISEVIKDVDAAQKSADDAMDKANEGVSKAEAAQLAADAAQKVIDDFLTGENVSEAVDTLKDIQEELKTLGEAVELTEAFAAKADKTTTISAGTGLTGGGSLADNRTISLSDETIASLALADSAVQPGVLTSTLNDYYTKTDADAEFMNGSEVDAKIAAAFNGENSIKVDEAAHADDATHADEADEAAHAVNADNATNAQEAAHAADADKLGGAVAADYLKKADAPGYADILTKTDAAVAYQPKGDYASKEQGEKADSALQSIATPAGSGLKVSAKSDDNSQTVEFDETVVFVFNCGSATVNID